MTRKIISHKVKMAVWDEQNFQRNRVMRLLDRHRDDMREGPVRIIIMNKRDYRRGRQSANEFHEQLLNYRIHSPG